MFKLVLMITMLLFCVSNWRRRISNVSNFSFRNYSVQNIRAQQNDLSGQLNSYDILDKVNINENFNNLNSITEKSYFKNSQVKTKTAATQKLSKILNAASFRSRAKKEH